MLLISVSNLIYLYPKTLKIIQIANKVIIPISLISTLVIYISSILITTFDFKKQEEINTTKIEIENCLNKIDAIKEDINSRLKNIPLCSNEIDKITKTLQQLQENSNIGLSIKNKKNLINITPHLQYKVASLDIKVASNKLEDVIKKIQEIEFIKITKCQIKPKDKTNKHLVIKLEIEIFCHQYHH